MSSKKAWRNIIVTVEVMVPYEVDEATTMENVVVKFEENMRKGYWSHVSEYHVVNEVIE